MTRRFLVTGGAGYVGSHVVLALVERGDEVVYRAVLCYLTAQNTPAAWDAIKESGYFTEDKDDVARLDTGEFDGPGVRQ